MAKSNYEHVKEWRKRNPDKVNAQAKRRREKHPDKFTAAKKRYRTKHGDRIRPLEAEKARETRKTEGHQARIARFRAKKEAERAKVAGRVRPNICDVCKQNNIRIVFDHCHVRGHFRGWICDRCNRVLGLIKDDPKLLKDLARYLERSDGKTHCEGEEFPSLLDFCRAGSELSN